MKTDREKLMELFEQAHKKCDSINCVYVRNACKYDGLDYCFEEFLADHLISKGVTIPVRCKDCKYFYLDDERGLGWCVYCSGNVEVSENGYCYRGERKEE